MSSTLLLSTNGFSKPESYLALFGRCHALRANGDMSHRSQPFPPSNPDCRHQSNKAIDI